MVIIILTKRATMNKTYSDNISDIITTQGNNKISKTIYDVMSNARYMQCVDILKQSPDLVDQLIEQSSSMSDLQKRINIVFDANIALNDLMATNWSKPEIQDLIVVTYAKQIRHRIPVPQHYIEYVYNRLR